MQTEINGRVLNNLVLYVQKHKPASLPQLLAGLNAAEIADQHAWVSLETRDLLFRRAEEIFGRADILEEVGAEVFALRAMGILDSLFRLEWDLSKILKLSEQYSAFYSTTAEIKVRSCSSKECVIEHREPGMVRGSCYYRWGFIRALLNLYRRPGGVITESQCAIPIWEKGLVAGGRFYLREGKVWREEAATGRREDLGPVSQDGTFTYAGTTYGAPACLYRIRWKRNPGWWWRWTRNSMPRRRSLEMVQHDLFDEYRMVEHRNRQLHQSAKLLQGLVQQKSDLALTLERKVADRTLELEDLVKQLQELDEMKSYFLTLTSHELRTPLTIIKVALNLLLTEGERLSPEKFRRYLLMARTNADHLQMLIANLLDLSRLESGQMKLEVENLDLVRLLRESLEEFRDLLERRELNLTTALPDALPKLVADQVRLKQIINNLLSNAVKFTPPRGTIHVSLEASGEHVLIQVADSGIGIESWEFERIFRKFQQSERSLTREASGIGLGLAIVKEFVELHEGRVWVESEKGKGAKFCIQLPMAGPKNPQHFIRRESITREDPPMILESH